MLQYGDKVKVIGGFYSGLIGNVSDRKESLAAEEYYFETLSPFGGMQIRSVSAWINADSLQKAA